MTRMACALGLTLLLLTGCSGGPEPAPKPTAMRRFQFVDREPNQPTGKPLPGEDTVLVSAAGEKVALSDYLGQPVVLVFNRGWVGFVCPYCVTYTAQIAEAYPQLRAAGAEVLLIYPTEGESPEQVAEFVKACDEALAEVGKAALPFPVFLDPGLKVVRKYNLLGELSKPSTFVLDREGNVRYAYVGANPDERPAVDRILREVQALGGQ